MLEETNYEDRELNDGEDLFLDDETGEEDEATKEQADEQDIGEDADSEDEADREAEDASEQGKAPLAEQREDGLMQTTLQEVQSEYPGILEKAALEIAKARAAQKRQEYESTAAQAQAAQEAEKLNPWNEFVARYPNIKEAKDLPQTVIDEMASGCPPVEAMQRYELAELKKQLSELNKKQAADRKNNDNKQKSTGSAASMGAETRPDAFFAGFDS